MPKNRYYKKPKMDEDASKLIAKTDIEFVNAMLSKSEEMKDFAISKSTLSNIAAWALNGESDKEILEHLDLTDHQFAILCTVCPTLIMIMENSRAVADLVIAGSLVQTAIGGKHIRKQQLIKVGVYVGGEKVGEKVEKHWVEEELPPNPMLLKFLAENKLNENFGEIKGVDESKTRELVEQISEHDRKLIKEAAQSIGKMNGNN